MVEGSESSPAVECITAEESEAMVAGRLPKDRMLDLEDHAKSCDPCRIELERVGQVRETGLG